MAVREPYTQLLYRAHALIGDTIVLDPAFLYVLRNVTTFFPNPLGGLFHLIDGLGATVYQRSVSLSADQNSQSDEMRTALAVGDTLTVFGGNTPDVYLTVYKFTLPA